MSVSFNQHQQVVNIEDEGKVGRINFSEKKMSTRQKYFADNQHLQSPYRVPLDRMTSRSDNPYSQVQEQLTQVDNASREERTERQRIRRIFDKVRHFTTLFVMIHYRVGNLSLLVRREPRRLFAKARDSENAQGEPRPVQRSAERFGQSHPQPARRRRRWPA